MNINNLSFKKKLTLLELLPFAGLLLFAAEGIKEKASVYFDMKRVVELVIFSTKLSSFVHEMQKERGATAVYLGSEGKEYRSEANS